MGQSLDTLLENAQGMAADAQMSVPRLFTATMPPSRPKPLSAIIHLTKILIRPPCYPRSRCRYRSLWQ